ncbi:MAG: nucleotidyltransferase domain-containing protein [Treponema sp.]|nr:nucleotidyltransferase domain-containing protein [Treponema sp.]MBR7079483.1 nucleotidyltransferase domain-containing protein [Treponema sp.]
MLTEEAKLINERLKTVMNPNRIYLFGSYAKNTQRADSDYDFYIVMPDDAGNEILLGQKAYRSLRGIRKTPVDIVVGHESAFERLKTQPTLEREVFRDGVILYEK